MLFVSHNVEQMFYVREKPWHSLGVRVEEALSSTEAIIKAGLDWEVVPLPVFVNGSAVPNYVANVRNSDNSVLGIVTSKYTIVQNKEAFEFTDLLLNNDVRYETAGSLAQGKRIWLLAKMPDKMILDDKVEPYLVFSNTHDGTGAIKVCLTPIRVVCQNTLNFAFSGTKRSWSTKHMGDMNAKLAEAKHTLELADSYMLGLNGIAEKMSKKTMTDPMVEEFLEEMFPLSVNASDRRINNVNSLKDGFRFCYTRPDIDKFRGTAWGAANAISDLVTHMESLRPTDTYKENLFLKVSEGHSIIDKAFDLLVA
jgi:phage/plasmid-like protein (TIGR03299 family)